MPRRSARIFRPHDPASPAGRLTVSLGRAGSCSPTIRRTMGRLASTGSDLEAAGRFRVIRRIGEGGMGAVYEAEDRKRGRRVALKTLRRVDAETLYRMKNEFRALADLSHPNLIALYDLFIEGQSCYFTMELIEGPELLPFLRAPLQNPLVGGGQASPDTIRLAKSDLTATHQGLACDEARLRLSLPQITRGLMALHEAGKIHRDVKPSNLVVEREERVVLLDFGLVTVRDDALDDSTPDGITGTIAYMAPEQAFSDARLSPAADFYALGGLLYEALTGHVPFQGTGMRVLVDKQRADPAPPRTLVPACPPDLDALCLALLSRDAERRPDGAEILQRLGVTAPATRPPSTGRFNLSGTAALCGRDAELERLEHLAGRSEGARVALVTGASGIGKTALVQSFLGLARLRDSTTLTLEGRCYERETVAYQAMDSLVDQLTRVWRRLPPELASAILPREPALLARLFPVLGRVPVLAAAPPAQASFADAQEQRTRAFGAFRELLQRLAERRPLWLFLDDLQWVDVNTLSLLAEILRPPDVPSLLLILGSRDAGVSALEEMILQTGLPTERIDLEPLRDHAASELCGRLLGRPVPALIANIVKEAAGNPFFIGELVQHVQTLDRKSLRGIDLRSVVSTRLMGLSVEARRFLTMVALAGEPISRRAAATATGLSASDFVRELGTLRTLRFLRSSGPRDDERLEPYHNRIRDAALGTLAADDRRHAHRALAEALEQWNEGTPDRLARHFHGAGEAARAARHARKAAEAAREALDFDRAADLFLLALELGASEPDEQRALLQELGDALVMAGRPREGAQTLMLAAEGADADTALDLRRRSSEALLRGGHFEEGVALIKNVLARLGQTLAKSPRRALWSLLWRRAWLRLRGPGFRERAPAEIPRRALLGVHAFHSAATGLALNDVVRGADYQARWLLAALRLGEPTQVGLALALDACFLASIGSLRRAERRTATVADLAHRHQDRHLRAWVDFCTAACAFFVRNDWHQTRACLHDAAGHLQTSAARTSQEAAAIHIYGGLTRLYLGEISELQRLIPGAVREAEQRGDRYLAVTLRCRLGIVWLARDDPDGGLLDLEYGIGSWASDRNGFDVTHFYALFGRCENALYRGDARAAEAALALDLPLLERSLLLRVLMVRTEVLHLRGRIAIALGTAARGSERTRHASQARGFARRLRRARLPLSRALSPLLEAGAAMLDGQRASAELALASALEALRALDTRLYAAAAAWQLGRLTGGSAHAALRDQATAFMKQQGIQHPERMATMLAPLGLG